MKYLYISALWLFTIGAYSQKENANWVFGHNAGLTFKDDGTVSILYGSGMSASEGSASISDSSGNLLFYTDGRSVWDRNNVKMPGGDYSLGTGLFGDPSSTQSAIIIPKKGDPYIYYIFTVDEPHEQNAAAYPNPFTGPYVNPYGTIPADDDGRNNGINYSIVDLSIVGSNGSLGNVVSRNHHLLTYNIADANELKYKCSEKISAVSNAQGTGYWVITHFVDRFYAFEITASGVNHTPVVTQISPVVPVSGYRRNAIGAIKVSPNGSKIVVAHNQKGTVGGAEATNGGVYLYDFNPATGLVSNPITVSNNTTPYGVEFSPKGSKLYVCYSYNLNFGGQYQYNLLSPDIASSGVQIGADGQGMFQLAPNGKIYMARGGSEFLATIDKPDADGYLCNFDMFGQYLDSYMTAVIGLPQFIAKENAVLSTNNPIKEHFVIYPNPASSTVIIKGAGSAIQNIYIMDSSGRTLKRVLGNDQEYCTLDLQGLSSGVYYISIHTEKGDFTQKLIKK